MLSNRFVSDKKINIFIAKATSPNRQKYPTLDAVGVADTISRVKSFEIPFTLMAKHRAPHASQKAKMEINLLRGKKEKKEPTKRKNRNQIPECVFSNGKWCGLFTFFTLWQRRLGWWVNAAKMKAMLQSRTTSTQTWLCYMHSVNA